MEYPADIEVNSGEPEEFDVLLEEVVNVDEVGHISFDVEGHSCSFNILLSNMNRRVR